VYTGINLPTFQRSVLPPSTGRSPQSTRRYNPEDSHLHSHRRENRNSYKETDKVKLTIVNLAVLVIFHSLSKCLGQIKICSQEISHTQLCKPNAQICDDDDDDNKVFEAVWK
jgi:hypothetical protein